MNVETAKLYLETSKLMGVNFLPVGFEATLTENNNDSNIHKQSLLEQLCATHESSCPLCTAPNHTQAVFGSGNPDASLLFIGDSPNVEEVQRGIPFVGETGEKLDQIIQAIGFNRDDVYISNVIKSRLEDDRAPLPTEVEQCGTFLQKQIEIIEPAVIVTLGSVATKYILNTNDDISRLRGQWGEFRTIPVLPTFHPAFLLRYYTTENRQQVWNDMQKVISKLGQ